MIHKEDINLHIAVQGIAGKGNILRPSRGNIIEVGLETSGHRGSILLSYAILHQSFSTWCPDVLSFSTLLAFRRPVKFGSLGSI